MMLKYLVLTVVVVSALLAGIWMYSEGRSEPVSLVWEWNQRMLERIALNETAPPEAALYLSLMHHSMYQVGIETDFTNPRLVEVAAARVFESVYPEHSVAAIRSVAVYLDDPAVTSYLPIIERVIKDVSAHYQQTDPFALEELSFSGPGVWGPTPPDYESAMNPEWAGYRTVVAANHHLEVPAPPALESTQYAQEWQEVYQWGAAFGSLRTLEETEIAYFWADGLGTVTPVGHWNQIAMSTLEDDWREQLKVMALLNIALYDASIITWREKSRHNFWRPIHGIQQAHTDGNAQTSRDLGWVSLLENPNFAEYPSGHSVFSATAAEVLSILVGEKMSFTSTAFLSKPRDFKSFWSAAYESGMSRIYGGIHFQSANQEGHILGIDIAHNVIDNEEVIFGNSQNATQ